MRDWHSLLYEQVLTHFGGLDKVPAACLPLLAEINARYRELDERIAAIDRSSASWAREFSRHSLDMQMLLQSGADIAFRLSPNGTVIDFTAGTVDDPFYRGELRGRLIQEIPTPATGLQIDQALVQLRKTGSAPVSIEYDIFHEGRRQFYEARLMLPVGDQVICIIRNTTQQRETSENLNRRNEAIIRYQTALLDMANGVGRDLQARMRQIVRDVARILPARRVGIWRFNSDRTAMVCQVLYCAGQDTFESGMEIPIADGPAFFASLRANTLVVAHDTARDARTRGLAPAYLAPHGVTALLAAPIGVHSEVVGMLCHEHTGAPRTWNIAESEFAEAVANMITLNIETAERRNAEAAREQSLSLHRATLEATSDGILVVDMDGQVVSFNQRFPALWELPPGKPAAGSAWAWDLGALIDPEAFLATIRRVTATPELESSDVLAFRDGRVFECHGRPQRIGGKVVGRVWSFRDVTRRVQSERALQYRVDFEQLIARLSTHFINLPVEAIDTSIHQAIKAIGEFMQFDRCSVFRVDPAVTALKLTHQWVRGGGTPAEHAQEIPLANLAGLAGRIRDHEVTHVDDVAALPPGPERDIFAALGFRSVALIPMLSGGSLHGLLCLHTVDQVKTWDPDLLALLQMAADIVVNALQRKETEEALKKSDEQLRHSQKLDAVGRLAGGIAHDFNNLLTSIIGFGDLALERLPAHDPVRTDIGQMLSAAQRAARLTSQLLTLGRKQMLRIVRMDLNELVAEMDSLLRRTLGEDIDITTIFSEEPAWIDADISQIEQVVMNLAVNARDAMPLGGALKLRTSIVRREKTPSAESAGTASSCFVSLTVTDNGCGMLPQVRERAFEPFFTTKTDGKGTGLGLATVYAIVRRYGGHIDLLSEVGKGTTVEVFFPTASAPESREGGAGHQQPAGGSETILLVEDETSVRTMASRILSSLGYNILTASNGTEALQVFASAQHRIDMVLTDVVMPHMGGPELIEQLHKSHNHFKVLFTTGYPGSSSTELESPNRRGAVLPKPYTRNSLAKKVREVLDGVTDA